MIHIRSPLHILFGALIAALAVSTSGVSGADKPEKLVAELKPALDGAYQHLGGMLGTMHPLSKEKPDGLKKGIDDPSVRYGVLPTLVTDKGLFVAVTESADSKKGRLYVDLNGDGDLTNDPLPADRNSRWVRRGPAAFQSDLGVKAGDHTVRLSFFRYTNEVAKGEYLEKRNNPLFVHRDDVREGKLTLGGTAYTVMLYEPAARGRYDDLKPATTPDGDKPAVALFIDRDNNVKYDRDYERYDLAKPFTVDGVTYELDRVTADGSELVVRRSAKSVPEVPVPLNAIGRPAPKFKAKLLDGGEVNFPDDFKGKVVLLNFWATWCEPCVGRKPQLVRTHDRLNGKGVEIVGVCLDGEEAREQAAAACKKFGVTWPQAFDGKGTKGEVATRYGVSTLPAALLVDGTTGQVLAPAADVKADGPDKSIDRVLAVREALKGK